MGNHKIRTIVKMEMTDAIGAILIGLVIGIMSMLLIILTQYAFNLR